MIKGPSKQERKALYEAADGNDRIIMNFLDIHRTMHFLYEGRASQKHILIILSDVGTITQQKLTERLGIMPGSASEVLSKLEKCGLILRTENPNDRRTTDITLTDKGRASAAEAFEQQKNRHKEMLSCLSEEEKCELLSLLEKINADWEERYKSSSEQNSSRCRKHRRFDGENSGECDGNCRECTLPCRHGKNCFEKEKQH